jgi:hypothetical protein
MDQNEHARILIIKLTVYNRCRGQHPARWQTTRPSLAVSCAWATARAEAGL